MKKIILFLVTVLILSCFTACDAFFETIDNILDSDPNSGEDENALYFNVTLHAFDETGEIKTSTHRVQLYTGKDGDDYQLWLDNVSTPYDVYRYTTCYDILVNGEPMKEGYTIKPEDHLELTEKSDLYTFTINETRYDGTSSTHRFYLHDSVEVSYLLELISKSYGYYGPTLEYFEQAYTVTAGGVGFNIYSEISHDMEIDVYKKAPLFTAMVCYSYHVESIELYKNTDLYTLLVTYLRMISIDSEGDFCVYFENNAIDTLALLQKYSVTKESNTVYFKIGDLKIIEISTPNETLFISTSMPADLDKLFMQYLGISYEEAKNHFIIYTEGKIVNKFLVDGNAISLKPNDDKDSVNVTINSYGTSGNFMYSTEIAVKIGARIKDINVHPFDPGNHDFNIKDFYIEGRQLSANDLNSFIYYDLTIEYRPPIVEVPDNRPTTLVYFEVVTLDEHDPRFDFMKPYYEHHESSEFGEKNEYVFDTEITVEKALMSITGYTYKELLRKGIYLEPYSYDQNRILAPNDGFKGECKLAIFSGSAIELKIRYGNNTFASAYGVAHTEMPINRFIQFSETISDLTPDKFTGRALSSVSAGLASPNYYGIHMSHFIDRYDDPYVAPTEKTSYEGTMIISDYDEYEIEFYHNDTYVKTVKYSELMKITDLFKEVPAYNENSCCHINGYIYTEIHHGIYIFYNSKIVIYDTYTPGTEEEKAEGLA